MKDYYKILEVHHEASAEEIRKAYKKMALKFHPDKNNDLSAIEKFKEIAEAYAVLKSKKLKLGRKLVKHKSPKGATNQLKTPPVSNEKGPIGLTCFIIPRVEVPFV